ncbi:MAG: hypothetical protein V2I34_03255 [Bacteroidales bacterium]|nr:hypothetical protein [Bacteroidales bacterium]
MLRIILIGILIILIVSMIGRFLSGGRQKGSGEDERVKDSRKKKGVPDDMGEYVDYEELDDDD